MVRVGDFAKGLLLRGNRDVATVVMCQKPPTKALLETVLKMLPDKLKELKPEKGYQVCRILGMD
jgi:zinc finger RNA-binding protein